MHENAIKKIKAKILGSLKHVAIVDNWPQYESFNKHVDSLSNEVIKHKADWLKISDVYSIYYDLVFEFIISKEEGENKFSGSLSDLVSDEELITLANTLSDFYLSVPRQYSIYLPLPKISKNIKNSSISISDNIHLVCFKESSEIPGGNFTGLRQFSNHLALNKVYLKIDTEGYCNSNLENKTLRNALSNFKILIQQGLSIELIKQVEGQPAGIGLLGGLTHFQIPKSNIISVDKSGESERVVSTELPIEISKLLDNIDFNWDKKSISKSLANDVFEAPIEHYWMIPSLLISSQEIEAKRIRRAIEWSFDSRTNENETLSFLQTCIGLESLLGDSESNGSLTETLADRCSYLIADDIKSRKMIKEHFKDLYKVRSKLVHGVNITLEHDQKWYKNWGQTILEFAIKKEIKYLKLK